MDANTFYEITPTGLREIHAPVSMIFANGGIRGYVVQGLLEEPDDADTSEEPTNDEVKDPPPPPQEPS